MKPDQCNPDVRAVPWIIAGKISWDAEWRDGTGVRQRTHETYPTAEMARAAGRRAAKSPNVKAEP